MSTNKDTLKFYWKEIRKYKVSFFTMLIGVPLASLFIDTALPYFLSQAVGTLTTNDTDALWQFIALASAAALIGVGFNLLGFQSAIYHEGRVRRNLVNNTIENLLQKIKISFLIKKSAPLPESLLIL